MTSIGTKLVHIRLTSDWFISGRALDWVLIVFRLVLNWYQIGCRLAIYLVQLALDWGSIVFRLVLNWHQIGRRLAFDWGVLDWFSIGVRFVVD